MIVEHQQPTDQVLSSGNDLLWDRPISSLTYGEDETAIFGFTSNSDGTGTAFPRGTIIADLKDSDTITLQQSEGGQEQQYSYSIVQWPRSTLLSFTFEETLSLADRFDVPAEKPMKAYHLQILLKLSKMLEFHLLNP